MKTILAISLITAAAFAAIPTAVANNTVCQGTLCVYEGSYTYGADCSNGGSGNYVDVVNYDGASYTGVYAANYCGGDSNYPYNYGGVSAQATHFDANGYQYAGAAWSSFDSGSYHYCDMSVADYDGTTYDYHSLGCPAGNPPSDVPALLP